MLWQEDCNHLKVDIDNYYKNMRDQFIIFLIDTLDTHTHMLATRACMKNMISNFIFCFHEQFSVFVLPQYIFTP